VTCAKCAGDRFKVYSKGSYNRFLNARIATNSCESRHERRLRPTQRTHNNQHLKVHHRQNSATASPAVPPLLRRLLQHFSNASVAPSADLTWGAISAGTPQTSGDQGRRAATPYRRAPAPAGKYLETRRRPRRKKSKLEYGRDFLKIALIGCRYDSRERGAILFEWFALMRLGLFLSI